MDGILFPLLRLMNYALNVHFILSCTLILLDVPVLTLLKVAENAMKACKKMRLLHINPSIQSIYFYSRFVDLNAVILSSNQGYVNDVIHSIKNLHTSISYTFDDKSEDHLAPNTSEPIHKDIVDLHIKLGENAPENYCLTFSLLRSLRFADGCGRGIHQLELTSTTCGQLTELVIGRNCFTAVPKQLANGEREIMKFTCAGLKYLKRIAIGAGSFPNYDCYCVKGRKR